MNSGLKIEPDAMHKVSEVNSEELSATDKDTPAAAINLPSTSRSQSA
jgi:hypothetical protein